MRPKKYMVTWLPFLVFAGLILGFSKYFYAPGSTSEAIPVVKSETTTRKEAGIPVKVIEAKKRPFSTVLFSNGKIVAERRVEVKLRTNGRIEQLPIRNGSFIHKADLLCQQEEEALKLQLEEGFLKYDQALLNRNILLIEQGGDAGDTLSVSETVLKTIHTKSGLKEAQLDLKKTQYELKQTRIYAPISGWITALKLNKYQEGSKGESICSIINPSSFKLYFTVLERDISVMAVGNSLSFGPVNEHNLPFRAKIDRIVPVVDQHGLITVIANIEKGHTKLLEGMKVNVRIEKSRIDRIVIPKEARVLRNNKDVVFTVDRTTNLVNWKYVTIDQENDTHLAVSEGLQEGDLVIYHNNLNLDQDTRVKIID